MNKIFGWTLLLMFFILGTSCESEKRIPPKGYLPVSPQATASLEASYFWIAQDKVQSAYWKDAPYIEVTLSNELTGNLYPDGYLNATGTYHGLSNFNRGKDPELRLKAGYDDEYIYILVEWKDTTLSPSYMARLFEGPADPFKDDTTGGWTSQGNQDSFELLFDLEGSTTKDTWKWSLANTAPFNMALNLGMSASGELIGDDLQYTRNGSVENSRSAPASEWNGNRQEVTLPDGSTKLLDPSYFLTSEFTTAYTGDPVKGRHYFNEVATCSYCHGPDANGEPEDPNNNEGGLAHPIGKSRESLINFIDDHPGGAPVYFGRIKNDPEKVNDLLAFLRGIGGLPGYILEVPEMQPEIIAASNVGTGSISSTKNSRYQVLLKRKLQNSNSEDVQFSPDKTYTFSIRLTDNDDINYVGASALELIFKSNEL